MPDPQGMDSAPDFHNVTLIVSEVRDGQISRNPHQNIKAIVNLKLTPEQARTMRDKLDKQLTRHFKGMDVIRLTLEGDFQ